MITPRTNTGKTIGAAIMQQLETEATLTARQSKGTVQANLYVAGESRGITKEQAYARTLEANPEAYEVFRKAHNAAPMVKALRDAGVLPEEQ
jgi:hypothetical protein